MKERVISVKGYTYNIENGKIEKTKLESSMISDSRINDARMLKKLAMPQVKEGSVIELQYRLESDYYYEIDSWYAQTDIPVLYTDCVISVPDAFNFSFSQRGFNEIAFKKTPAYASFSLTGRDEREPATEYKFVGMNIPALKPEGYVFCPSAYKSCVDLEIRSINIPGFICKDFTSTWNSIGEKLMEDEDFGGRIRRTSAINVATYEVCVNVCVTTVTKWRLATVVRLVIVSSRQETRNIVFTLRITLRALKRWERNEDHQEDKTCDSKHQDHLDDRKAFFIFCHFDSFYFYFADIKYCVIKNYILNISKMQVF